MPEETGTTTDTLEQASSRTSKTKSDKKKAPKGKAKAAKKGKAKGAGGVKKVGVISAIVTLIARQEGASTKEIAEVLAKKFPERDVEGMTTTVRIQMTRLPKRFGFEMKKTRDEKRGLVYKAPAAIVKQLEKGSKEE